MATDDDAGVSWMGGDGAADRIWKRGSRPPVAVIFVHAGAGYHSTTNERVHLEACSEAARVGMKFLRTGGTAADAVEAAIRSLEDKEITNAGFGSNLNMDGVVECDATIVDHLGRSGACGAVPGIKNPISLAKMILDASGLPLSLRRVPPNILVGVGASEFAEEHGMTTTPNDALVSKNARDRYLRWSDDLRRADAKQPVVSSSYCYPVMDTGVSVVRDHTTAILAGTWNEGQPDSPSRDETPLIEHGPPPLSVASTPSHSSHSIPSRPTATGGKFLDRSPLSFIGALQAARAAQSTSKRSKGNKLHEDSTTRTPSASAAGTNSPTAPASSHDGSASTDNGYYNRDASGKMPDPRRYREDRDSDVVNDTVGAIAIDMQGKIAAGSSSGGIGMKHKGRIGPAALIGIGTAIIPEDPHDEQLTSVAAVTSGTGEHMATSLASAKCAERIYQNSRRGSDGRDVLEADERTLLDSFIREDFMHHPGVRSQNSTGAIGVMAAKKTATGIYFYFAHNTDSFALASFSSFEREPTCVMSRLGQAGEVTQGARKIPTS